MKYAGILLFFFIGAVALALAGPIREFSHRDDYVPPTPIPTLTRLTNDDGSPVSRNVAHIFRGPEHCNWESALFLMTGDPIGTQHIRGESERWYLRDPESAYPERFLATTFDGDATLSPGAMPLNYNWEGLRFWLEPAFVDTALYVEYDDHVERWPRASEIHRCA